MPRAPFRQRRTFPRSRIRTAYFRHPGSAWPRREAPSRRAEDSQGLLPLVSLRMHVDRDGGELILFHCRYPEPFECTITPRSEKATLLIRNSDIAVHKDGDV